MVEDGGMRVEKGRGRGGVGGGWTEGGGHRFIAVRREGTQVGLQERELRRLIAVREDGARMCSPPVG